MVAVNTTKNANFIRIVTILRNLRDNGSITEREYLRAKKYYLKLTGADRLCSEFSAMFRIFCKLPISMIKQCIF